MPAAQGGAVRLVDIGLRDENGIARCEKIL